LYASSQILNRRLSLEAQGHEAAWRTEPLLLRDFGVFIKEGRFKPRERRIVNITVSKPEAPFAQYRDEDSGKKSLWGVLVPENLQATISNTFDLLYFM
jgi:hypothetical protein